MMSYSLNSLLVPSQSCFGGLSRDSTKTHRLNENNNDHMMLNGNDKIQEIWNQHIFKAEKVEQALNHNDIKVSSWINENISEPQEEPAEDKPIDVQENDDEQTVEPPEMPKEDQNGSPSHHARRPMNAFLIFCKKHRPIVRERFPNLENRGVTKILGEWWSLLEEKDKTPFTNLANEYKDAFLSANPDFKWYKLPAPPLRTLAVRPPPISTKLPSPQSSPSHASLQIFNEFNPGKLADESQLGSLTSLMNNNFSSAASTKVATCCENRENTSADPMLELGENNNKIEQCDTSLQSPVNLIKEAALPPMPIKKRIFQQYSDSNTKEVSRNILITEDNETYSNILSEHQIKQGNNSMTNQDIVDKVVDNMLVERNVKCNFSDLDNTRKSGRQCKGKRYEKFMVEGKLLGNKKEPKLTQHKLSDLSDKPVPERKSEIVTPNLENTIRRLAERTKLQIAVQNEDDEMLPLAPKEDKEDRCGSETSEPSSGSNFNLDLKIGNLPCLSYDAFVQKKRDSKKKKLRKVGSENIRNGVKLIKKDDQPVGSRKRKNKHSITHLEKKKEKTDFISDLTGLATLAEVAANTQKINETK